MKRNGETAEGVQMLQKGGKVNYVGVLDKRPHTRTRKRAQTPAHARTTHACTGRNTHARAQAVVRNMHACISAQTRACTSAKHTLTHEHTTRTHARARNTHIRTSALHARHARECNAQHAYMHTRIRTYIEFV